MIRLSFLLCLAIAITLPVSGFAQPPKSAAPKLIGSFGNWKANTDGNGDQLTCYMTLPIHFAPNIKFKRGPAWLTITHRPGENSKDVVSYTAGYNFKSTSDVEVEIGKKSFDLFTQKDTAWSRDAATDHALAAAIRDGSRMTIKGEPAAKSIAAVTDTLDTKGAAAAYQAIGKACGYPDESRPKAPVKKKKPSKTH